MFLKFFTGSFFLLSSYFGLFSNPLLPQNIKIPSPKVKVLEKKVYETDNGKFTFFRLTITNWEKFPAELFEISPNLPPCGKNKNSSRTWIRFYSNIHKRLYGHCGIKSPEELINHLGF